MAECALNRWGAGKFQAYSTGSHFSGKVHPITLRMLKESHYPTAGLRSKDWQEFAHCNARVQAKPIASEAHVGG